MINIARRKTLNMIKILLALLLVSGLLLGQSVSGQSTVTVSVGSNFGSVGSTVTVPLTISNHSGVAGGDFKIYYNNSVVQPSIVDGNIDISSNYICIANTGSDGGGTFIHIVLANLQPLPSTATICTITFDLINGGSSTLALSGIKLFDINGQQIYSGSVSAVSGSITVHKTPLARAGEPWWDGDTICWNDVNNAASYRAVLYRNGVHNEAVNNITGTSYKFGARISNQGLGSYTVTVQAIAADSGVYSDGPVSVSSDANVKSTTLARVDQPTWDGDTIRWKEVPDASGYRVVLYKDGSQNQSIDAAGLAHNFGARMDSQGPGSYTVSVQARGDNVIYLHGQLSVQSTANTRHPKPALERAGRPWWDGKVIRWDAVDDAARYRVVLYRNGIQNQSVEVSGAFHNFGPRIDSQGAGSYTVTVQALAVAGGAYSDGPVSLSSSANVIEQAAQGREEEPGSDLAPVPVPGTPAWVAAADESGLLSTVAWAASEESVSSYRVTLFRGTEEVTVDEIAPGEGSSGTFRLDMAGHLDEPGLYYAVIEETAGGENANTAYYQSGILVVTAETGDGSGLFRASGYLPFAGVWLQFTAQNGIIGLFTLSSFGQTDHSPPEGLYAAGIFLEIILEQTLAGTTVRLEVDYEPGFLPEEIDESSMKLYRYNMETGAWEALESGVDKAENIVWAEVDGFSLLGVFGEMLAAKEPEPAGGFSLSSFISRYRYLLLAGLFVIIFLAAGFLIYRRAKR